MPRIAPGLAALAVLLGLFGCRSRDDLDGARRPIPGLRDAAADYQAPGADRETAFDFYDNRAAAAVFSRGSLLIDLGGPDLAKYSLGGIGSAWHPFSEERRAARLEGRAGSIRFPVHADNGPRRGDDGSVEIRLVARPATENQVASIYVNEERAGDVAMPRVEWRQVSTRVPSDRLREGDNQLRFYFRHLGKDGGFSTAASIQRIAIGGSAQADAPWPLRAETVTHGGERLSALRTAASSRLSFAVEIPAGRPALAMAVAGEGEAAIRVAVDGRPAETLWEGRATGAWQPVEIDLGALAGEVVRIDFASGGEVDWGRPRIVSPARVPVAPSSQPADHVIVWAVSSLRADRVDPAGTGFGRIAASGLRFERVTSPAPIPAMAHAALLGGRNPAGSRLPSELETLGDRFRRAGYATGLFSGNGFVTDDGGFARGFDHYANPMRRRQPHGAQVLWQEARKLLARHRDGRTFLYLAPSEPHLPYVPGEAALARTWPRPAPRIEPARTATLADELRAGRVRFGPEERQFITALYDACVSEVDAALAQMLADLEELGIAERTAIVVVGDHGEELFERGGFGRGESLYREVLAVPLLVSGPTVPVGVVAGVDLELVDVHATILELGGIAPGASVEGESGLGFHARAPLLSRPARARLPGKARALRLGRYEILVPVRGSMELFDLETDPGQTADLSDRRPVVMQYMTTVLGLALAYEREWSRRRWGQPNDVTAAFADDHGY